MATQGERRAETRRRLLDAAADLFAERGIDGASIDAIAERAERTSGAVYDHFGGKDGLLFALLEGWVDDVAAVIGAELVDGHDARRTPRRAVAQRRRPRSPATAAGSRLEHELWTLRRPQRRPPASTSPAATAAAWAGVDEAVPSGPDDGVERRRRSAPPSSACCSAWR